MVNILVIDDDNNMRKIISDILIDLGCQVRDAPDGEVGIEYLKKDNRQYNAVITDICMPKKNGNDVAKYIKENLNLKDMIVVGMTGIIEEAEKKLFDYLLPKPFKMKELAQIVDGLP